MASIINNFKLIISIKNNTNNLNKIIKNSLILFSIFLILITKCDSTIVTTTTITTNSTIDNTLNNKLNNISNKFIINNSNNYSINNNDNTSQNFKTVLSSTSNTNNNNFNINSNSNTKNFKNRNSKTLHGDYLSVDNFRRNIEHKQIENDEYNDLIELDNNNNNKNDNAKLIYNTLINDNNKNANSNNNNINNSDNIRYNNNDNITLEFHNLKEELLNSDLNNNMYNENYNFNRNIYLFNKNSKREIRVVPRDICEIGCKCEKDNAFFIVICDFVENKSMDSIFGSKLEIPSKTKSFIAKLDRDTQFRIDEGLFENNVINSIRIEGTQNGNEQIEISGNAFNGNNGPYPEITIIDVENVILRSYSFSGEFRLAVKNSGFVKIFDNAFHNTSFEGQFTNIANLRFDVGAFNKTQAKLLIEDSTIDHLNRFEASLREIRFENCTIGTIDTGAFDVNNINSIVFYKCKIDVFRTKAITEKLLSHNFSITNGDIRVIESEAISGSGIRELVLKNNNIDEIQSNAIYVIAVNATISRNNITKLGDKWLRIKDFTHIHINQNQFGDFGSMALEQTPSSQNTVFCKFENNTIRNPKPGSLNIPNKLCAIREISFYKLCSCNISWLEEITTRDLRSLSYCRIEDNLKFCFKRPVYNVLSWINEVCNYESATLDCMKSIQQKTVNSDFIDPADDQGFNVNWIYMIVGVILLVLLIITVFITSVKCYMKRQQQQQQQTATHLSESNSAVSNSGTPNGTAQKYQHVFSNDDRRIINQTLDILRERYPPDVYDEVNKNTQVLLRGNITEMQRVKAIGDIVQALDECQNTGEDFVAFTDIFYKHLASSNGTAPPLEPTYSEPVLQDDGLICGNVGNTVGIGNNRQGNNNNNNRGIGPYATTTVIPGITDIQTNIDHIYAEPTSAQQPLLTNEYASPADRNDDNMVDLYSEPISNERDRKIIPPYAIIGPKAYPMNQSSTKHQQQSPSNTTKTNTQKINQKNLPDVLHPSTSSTMLNNNNNNNSMNNIKNKHNLSNNNSNSFKPLTNVQKMAKNFANDPNFHITRSPTSNRRIPKYTVPNKRLPSDPILLPNQHHQQPSTSTSITSVGATVGYSQNYDCGSGTAAGVGNNNGNNFNKSNFNSYNINLSPNGETVGATSSSNTTNQIISGDNQSNHSGGSDITVQMDEIIEYVDA